MKFFTCFTHPFTKNIQTNKTNTDKKYSWFFIFFPLKPKNKHTNNTWKPYTTVPFPHPYTHVHTHTHHTHLHTISYQILCPKLLVGVADPKKCAGIILGETGLADDLFRLGNTKARRIFTFYSNLSNGKTLRCRYKIYF